MLRRHVVTLSRRVSCTCNVTTRLDTSDQSMPSAKQGDVHDRRYASRSSRCCCCSARALAPAAAAAQAEPLLSRDRPVRRAGASCSSGTATAACRCLACRSASSGRSRAPKACSSRSGSSASASSCTLRTAAPYDVLLGRLGDELLRRQGRDWQTFPKGQPQTGCQFFETTGHTVCEPFLSYWRTHGLEFDGRRGTTYRREPGAVRAAALRAGDGDQ